MKPIQNSDGRKHQHAVELLSRETQTSIERVSELYYIEHAKLERVARVKAFVPIFTSRKVRDVLRNDQSNSDWNADAATE